MIAEKNSTKELKKSLRKNKKDKENGGKEHGEKKKRETYASYKRRSKYD